MNPHKTQFLLVEFPLFAAPASAAVRPRAGARQEPPGTQNSTVTVVFGNWRWYSETGIRNWTVVFGNWTVVFGNWTVVFGNWEVVFGNWKVVFGNWESYSETGKRYSETGIGIWKLI